MRRFLIGGALGALVVVGLYVAALLAFGTDVSSDQVLQEVAAETELVVASESVDEVVTVEQAALPGPLAALSHQYAEVAISGEVDVYVDLSELSDDAISVDGTTATITLPPLEFSDPQISEIEWLEDRRGLIQRVEDLFQSDDDFRNDVVRQVNDDLSSMPEGGPEVEAQAVVGATESLESLLAPMGIEHVDVEFEASTFAP